MFYNINVYKKSQIQNLTRKNHIFLHKKALFLSKKPLFAQKFSFFKEKVVFYRNTSAVHGLIQMVHSGLKLKLNSENPIITDKKWFKKKL